ncbi:MAG TPA: Fe2+-dependent dioxygenase [Caulobacteraceae bacterium]|jgi:PKHD-type hydroxylase
MLMIEGVLAAEDLERVRAGLAQAPFRDGRATAGGEARKVKANRQALGSDGTVGALARFVAQALARNELLQLYARPAKCSPVMFNRYGPGERYGLHTDDAFMAEGEERLRTDLSFTLFLSEPDSYDGGELVVIGSEGERAVKLPAGSLILYPTGALHRVAEVTAGERLAAVGWIQSLLRRSDQRELLFDLARLRRAVGAGESRLLLDKSLGALLRMWGEG